MSITEGYVISARLWQSLIPDMISAKQRVRARACESPMVANLVSAKQLLLAAVSYFRARSARREQDLQADKRRAQAFRRLQLFKCRSKARLKLAKTLVAAATAIDASLAVRNNQSVLQSAGRRRVRVVRRAAGKWEGSTLNGYLEHGDEKTYCENFRMSKKSFEGLAALIISTLKMGADPETYRSDPVFGAMYCARNHPTPRFKVATCVFFLAHSGPLKATADAASVGKSTLRRWLEQFYDGVVAGVKPKYMPKSPPLPANLHEVHKQFAARRGIWNVAMACDGTHIPFRPTDEKTAQDYKNYQGWYSLLVVAFVNSFYMFVDASVGYPGRAGDNTVLRNSTFMAKVAADPTAWLGEGGVILGDGGASDGDKLFLNPIPQPLTPQECWFNFCHSSTRFVVEEAFGRLKNRFRFLLAESELHHRLRVKLIYLCFILHNFCTFHHDSALLGVPGVDEDPEWVAFFKRYERLCCPTCIRRNISHCVHQAQFRIGKRQQSFITGAPSAKRTALKDFLWQMLCMESVSDLSVDEVSVLEQTVSGATTSSTTAEVVREMARRASTGIIHDEQ